jgi:hypothetical protein
MKDLIIGGLLVCAFFISLFLIGLLIGRLIMRSWLLSDADDVLYSILLGFIFSSFIAISWAIGVLVNKL